MEHLNLPTSKNNPAVRSADRANASRLNRAAFATGLAQSAFGRAYVPPEYAGFVDRKPAEIAVIRATMWPEAAE